MNTIIKTCFQGVSWPTKKNCHFFNCIVFFKFLVECCKGKPTAKVALAVKQEPKMLKLSDRGMGTIYLVGENHYIGNEHQKFQRAVLELAAKKKLVYAMEGLERDDLAEQEMRDCFQEKGINGMSNGYLFGFEDPFFHLFNNVLDLNFLLRNVCQKSSNPSDPFTQIIESKKNDLLCPLVLKSNQESLKNFWNCKILQPNPIFAYLTKFKSQLIQKPFATQTAIFAKQIPIWKNLDWLNFTREASLIFGEDLKTTLPKKKLETLESLLKSAKEFQPRDDYHMSEAELSTFMTALHLILRNDFIATNLKAVYIRTKLTQKPLVAILGDEHISGITKILSKQGYTVLGAKELSERLKQN